MRIRERPISRWWDMHWKKSCLDFSRQAILRLPMEKFPPELGIVYSPFGMYCLHQRSALLLFIQTFSSFCLVHANSHHQLSNFFYKADASDGHTWNQHTFCCQRTCVEPPC